MPAKKTIITPTQPDGDKVAVVEEHVTTKRYVEDKSEDQDKDSTTNNQDSGKGYSNILENERYIPQSSTPRNRIAELFDELKSYSDDEGEVYYFNIVRKPDMMNDNFRRRCYSPEIFQPLQINVGMYLNFIPMLQHYNDNSGGRFDITVTDESGRILQTDVSTSGIVISNPPIVINSQDGGTNADNNMVELIRQMNEQSDKRFAQMLEAMKPQEDEFTKLAKEKLRKDILEPSEKKNDDEFNVAKTMSQVMSSMAVMNAMGEGFAKMFNRDTGSSDRDKGILESLLTNEMFLDRASGFGENLMNGIATIIMQGRQPVQNPNIQQPNQNTGYPPLQPQQQTQQEAENETMLEDTRELINYIIEELKSDNAINDDNESLKELKEEYPDIFPQIKELAVALPFDMLLNMLKRAVPETFTEFQNEDGTWKDGDGIKVYNRLKEFYEYLRVDGETKDKEVIKEK